MDEKEGLAIIILDAHQKHRRHSSNFLKPFSSLNRRILSALGPNFNFNNRISNTILEKLKIQRHK